MSSFHRVLVANRGEIALRVIRACHDEGLEAVAVFSDADRLSPHVRAADFAVPLGPSSPAESYLRIDKLLAAAADTDAGAIHPGYGFLAERAAFAQAVTDAGLAFVGPPASAISAMGDKTEARRRMAAAGVPIVPGLTLPVSDPRTAREAADAIGYPVLVKASAGGGGKGMRVVRRAEELEAALVTAASEALKAFGDASVYIEKYVERPRHVEIQILADHERTVHLGERECSIQRRHQKLVEEAPSAAVSPELRERMGAAAVAAAVAVGYRSAGTCEFLLAADGTFYFLEMNTRIQVEHPVTELVYGVDLVREQLRIAQGFPMGLARGPLAPRGWALECRITSEDSANGFLPSTGRLEYLRIPTGPGVRWDGGFEVGNDVTLFYDSLLGKVITWGATREDAIVRMRRALSELVVSGVATNQAFHLRLLGDAAFLRSEIDSQFLDRRPDLLEPAPDTGRVTALAIAAALAEEEARLSRRPAVADDAAAGSSWLAASRREGLR
ncbi:MAG: acetyl-CoA carboxylase biotin carboxylase subunit [Gemmatimonadota bacterium]